MKEVIDYLISTREGRENACWFLNKLDPHGELHITESLRGEFDGDIWYPTKDEMQICCLEHMPDYHHPYKLIEHCRTREHITELVKSLSDDEIGYLYREATLYEE